MVERGAIGRDVVQGEEASQRCRARRCRAARRRAHALACRDGGRDRERAPVRRALAIATTIATVFDLGHFRVRRLGLGRSRPPTTGTSCGCASRPTATTSTPATATTAPTSSTCPTWRSVGGSGRPDQASAAEQDYRALILYRNRGWEPVGLRPPGRAERGLRCPVQGRPAGRRQPERRGWRQRGLRRRRRPDGGTGLPRPAVPRGRLVGGAQGLAEADGHARLRPDRYRLLRAQDQGRRAGSAGQGRSERRRLHRAEDLGGGLGQRAGPRRRHRRATRRTAPTHRRPTSPAGWARPTAPAWPGRQFVQGDTDAQLQCFQKQLGSRGYGLTGTGFYGPATKTAVVTLQKRNGINPSGIVGPRTWARRMGGQVTPVRPRLDGTLDNALSKSNEICNTFGRERRRCR